MKKLTQPITVTTYNNVLDKMSSLAYLRIIKDDVRRLEAFTRFKPDLKLKYVYHPAC